MTEDEVIQHALVVVEGVEKSLPQILEKCRTAKQLLLRIREVSEKDLRLAKLTSVESVRGVEVSLARLSNELNSAWTMLLGYVK